MTGRHRQVTTTGAPVPIMVAGAVVGSVWVTLAIGSAETADAATVFTGMPNRVAHDDPPPRLEPPPEPLGRKVVDLALTKLGVPYVWGAKGPNAVDCSGLVQWSYKQVGVPLGPDTYTQVRQGIPVRDLQPGDLVFPSAEMGPRGPGHVQMYIGNGKVIEAPGRGMTVRIHAMPASYIAIRPTPQGVTP